MYDSDSATPFFCFPMPWKEVGLVKLAYFFDLKQKDKAIYFEFVLLMSVILNAS